MDSFAKNVILEILDQLRDDCILLPHFVSIVNEMRGGFASDDELRDEAFRIIRMMVEGGDIDVGPLRKTGGVDPWSGSARDILDKIKYHWYRDGGFPGDFNSPWIGASEKTVKSYDV